MFPNPPVRFVLASTEFFDLHLRILAVQPLSVCIQPPVSAALPLPDGHYVNRTECIVHSLVKALECVITMLAEIFLDGAPEEFNEIELTMVFREKKAPVPEPLDGLLHERFLFQKIWLVSEDGTSTAKV
jgi:hypothetical protein